MNTKRELMRFLAVLIPGGILYYLAEIFWRGYSFPAMAVVGGFAVYLCGRVDERCRRRGRNMPVLLQMPVCGLLITLVELLSGLILNKALGLNMWDYSGVRYNFEGQICLNATIAWALLSPIPIELDNLIGWKFFGEPAPRWFHQERPRAEPEAPIRRDGLAEYITKQEDIIVIQSEIIDGLFLELLQYRSAEEMDEGTIRNLKEAAKLREENNG